MADSFTIKVNLQGIANQHSLRNFGLFFSLVSAEKAMVSAGSALKQPVAALSKAELKRQTLATGKIYGDVFPTRHGNPKNYYVRGSKFLRHVPSARFIGLPDTHLVDKGHRIVLPGSKEDTGRRTKAFRILERAQASTQSEQLILATRTLQRELRNAIVFASKNPSNQSGYHDNYIRRLSMKEVRRYERKYG